MDSLLRAITAVCPATCFLPALLLIGTFASDAIAEPAEAYGKRFVRAGASWPAEAGAGVELPSPSVDPAMADQLRRRLASLEANEGPYSNALFEPLADLARALDAAGSSDEARGLRNRALHLVRINEGLNSPLQLGLLRDQLAADRRAGDFAALDQRYGYYFRLLGNGLPPYTPARFAATLEFLRWQREALRRDLGGRPLQRLDDLLRLNDELLEHLQSSDREGAGQMRLRAAASQLLNYYLLAELVDPPREIDEWGRAGPRVRDDFEEFNPTLDRLQNRRRALASRGDAMLETLLPAARSLGPASTARNYRQRADWAQWWGRSALASTLYSDSWQTLARAGLIAVARQWFSEPRPLPDNGVFLDPAAEFSSSALLTVSIDETGRARADLSGNIDELPGGTRRLPRWLRATRFRPALRDGVAQASVLEDVAFAVAR